MTQRSRTVVFGSFLLFLSIMAILAFRDFHDPAVQQAMAQGSEPVAYIQQGIQRQLDDATSTLNYVRTSNPQAFDAALKTLSFEDGRIVRALMERKK